MFLFTTRLLRETLYYMFFFSVTKEHSIFKPIWALSITRCGYIVFILLSVKTNVNDIKTANILSHEHQVFYESLQVSSSFSTIQQSLEEKALMNPSLGRWRCSKSYTGSYNGLDMHFFCSAALANTLLHQLCRSM